MKKITSYFLIFIIAFPPVFLYQPKEANALLPLLARSIITIAAKAGIGKYRNMSQLSLPLKPQRGKLYNLVFTGWTGAATASVSTHAAILGAISYFDKPNTICGIVKVSPTYAGFRAQTYGNMTLDMAVSSFNNWIASQAVPSICGNWYGNYTVGSEISLNYYTLGGTANFQFSPGSTCQVTPTSLQGGGITCSNPSTVTKSASEQYFEIELGSPNDAFVRDAATKNLLESARSTILNNPSLALDGSSGLAVEEVTSQTVVNVNPDGSLTSSTYTIDPTTGGILKDGVLMPDQATFVDINGVTHTYTIDPVTGDILDNGLPLGNFARWTDSSGVVHVVTVDPITGKLLDNGLPYNPSPTASNPSNPTSPTSPVTTSPVTTIDPYTGTPVTTGSTSIDFTPVIESNAKQLTEQKKTTDAINNAASRSQTQNQALVDAISKNDCSLNPDRAGCSTLGSITTPPSPLTNKPYDFTNMTLNPIQIVNASGACPAPSSVIIQGQSIVIDNQPMCDFFNWFRPAALAVAWLSCIFVFRGAFS